MINNANIFTTYESLFKNVIKILLTIYPKKIEIPEKSSKFRVHLKGELKIVKSANL